MDYEHVSAISYGKPDIICIEDVVVVQYGKWNHWGSLQSHWLSILLIQARVLYLHGCEESESESDESDDSDESSGSSIWKT